MADSAVTVHTRKLMRNALLKRRQMVGFLISNYTVIYNPSFFHPSRFPWDRPEARERAPRGKARPALRRKNVLPPCRFSKYCIFIIPYYLWNINPIDNIL